MTSDRVDLKKCPPSCGLAGDNQKLFTEEAPQKRPPQINARREQRRPESLRHVIPLQTMLREARVALTVFLRL